MLVCLLSCVLSLAAARPVHAHKVNVLGYVEGNRLVVEGYFAGKAKAVDCLVEVFAGDGAKLTEGRTDRSGVLKLELESLRGKGDIKLLLHAGSGHQADYTVKAEDLGAPSSADAGPAAAGSLPLTAATQDTPAEASPGRDREPTTAPVQAEAVPRAQAPAAGDSTTQQDVSVPAAGAKTFEEALDRRLEAKLAPIVKMLEAQRKMMVKWQDKGPGVVEIFGGIGWVFGLVGVAAYFLSRKKHGSGIS